MNLIYFFLIISTAINLLTAVIVIAIFKQVKPIKKPIQKESEWSNFSVGDRVLWDWIDGPTRGYYTIKEIFQNHISFVEISTPFDIDNLIDRRNLRKYTK